MNSTQNCTAASNEWSKYAYIIALVPLLALSAIAMIANCCVIIKFCRLKRNFTVNMKLTFSLAIADLWVSMLMLSALIGNSLVPQIVSRNHADMACFILTLEALKLGAIITSILHLLMLSANQCFSIINPFAHKVMITSSVCKLTLILIWMMPAFCFFLYFYGIPNQGFRSDRCTNLWPYHMRPFRMIVFCVIALPMFLMIKSYAVIWVYVNKSSSFQRWMPVMALRKRTSVYKRQIQTVITTSLIVGTFVFSWFPSILLYLMVCVDCFYRVSEVKPQLVFALSVTTMAVIFVKLSLNPFIYSPGIKTVRSLQLKHLHRMNNDDVVSFLERFRQNDITNCKDSSQMKQKDSYATQLCVAVEGSSRQLSLVKAHNTKCEKKHTEL